MTHLRRRPALLAAVPLAVTALLTAADPALAAGPVGTPGVGDPYFPLAGNGGYHVDHYGLTLRYDPGTRHLDGKAVLTARATQALTRFDLDLNGLKVTALTVDHVKAGHRRDGQELVVTPRRATKRQETLEVLPQLRARPGEARLERLTPGPAAEVELNVSARHRRDRLVLRWLRRDRAGCCSRCTAHQPGAVVRTR